MTSRSFDSDVGNPTKRRISAAPTVAFRAPPQPMLAARMIERVILAVLLVYSARFNAT